MARPFFRTRRRVTRKPARPASQGRRLLLEPLEDRRLLAGDWHNALLATDVNADRRVTPIDAVQLINKLKSEGTLELPALDAGSSPGAYYDTSNDGFLSPLDSLLVINAIAADEDGYVLTEVAVLNSYQIQATFDRPVMGALLSPDAYVLTGPDSSRLEILAVAEGESPHQVILASAAQSDVTYTLALDPSVTAAISVVASVKGKQDAEFYLQSAIALGSNSVLLTFSDPVDTETGNVESFYQIAAANHNVQDGGLVEISHATVEGRTVLLETTPLQNIQYQVTVTNVLDGYAKNPADRVNSTLIDPARNTASFRGIAPPAPPDNFAASFQASSSLFSDVFDNGSIDAAWTIRGGNWSESGGVFRQISTATGDTKKAIVTDQTYPANLEITAKLRVDSWVDGDYSRAGVGLRTNATTGAGYNLLFHYTGGTKNKIQFLNDGVAWGNAYDFAWKVGQWYWFKLKIEDGVLSGKVWADGQSEPANWPYVQTGWTDRPSGAPALNGGSSGNGNSTVSFDEVTLIDPTAPVVPPETPENSQGLPRLVGAASTGNTSVIVSFSQPMGDSALDPSHYVIVQENVHSEAGALLVIGAEFVGESNSTVKLTTMSQNELTYTVTVVDVRDADDNPMAPPIALGGVTFNPSTASFPGTPPGPNSADVESRVVSAIDRDGDGAIGLDDLLVLEQGVRYVVRDRNDDGELTLDGLDHILDANASEAIDVGDTVFMEAGFGVDSDGDGLTDNEEQRGWLVSVTLLDGSVITRQVTSDPLRADTDLDGFLDSAELALSLDPRDKDTDDDLLPDEFEFNTVFSDPASQDSDGDGLDDGSEHDFFHTSPLLADTDGDQFPDDLEIILDNRNPLLADLPQVVITTGNVDLRLDVRFEAQTSQGTTTIDSKSVNTSLVQAQESSQASESSSTTEWFVKAGGFACAAGGCEDTGEGKFYAGARFEAEAGGGGSTAASFTAASSRATQREFATSLSTDQEVSAESVVTRVVEGATIGVAVNIVNASNVAFAIRNIEITALTQDPRDPTSFTPVATLFAASDEPVTIGPLNPTRGPFRFSTTEAFPALVESLMQNPRGVLFRVANYEIEDEFGRNFSFVEQDINDRTAFFEIDYSGNAALEKHRVATTSDFDENGRPVGLTMKQVMEDLLGLEFVDEETDEDLNPFVREDAELIDRSYSTRIEEVAVITRDENGNVQQVTEEREVLFRVKGVSSKLTDPNRRWWVLTPQGLATPAGDSPGSDFSSVKVFAGQDFAFKFVKDLDDDALESDIEALYRSIDSDVDTPEDLDSPDSKDTDNDGIDDGVEVFGFFQGNRRVPWTIRPEDGQDAYTTFANPGRADTDLDGLTDSQELGLADITVWRDEDGVPTLDQEKVKQAAASGQPLEVITTFRRAELEPIDEEDRLVFIKDDGDFGFEVTTATSTTEMTVGFQDDSVDAIGNSFAKASAIWSFSQLPPGEYRVSATWPVLTDGRPNVNYFVSVDGGNFAIRPAMNQFLNLPNDLMADDATWEDLGYFTVALKGRIDVKLQGVRINADAIRLEQVQRYVTFPTDPSNPDSDGDGLTDAEEIAGFSYVTLLGKTSGSDVPETNTLLPDPVKGYATNPLSRDTDSDGFPDKREVQLGTDPTINDGDSVRDDDGDGLVNLQETTGWDVVFEGPFILDDGDVGFEYLNDRGPLSPSTSAGFDGDYHYSSAARDQDGVVYRFGALPPGFYRVSATWPQVAGAATDASFTVNVDGIDRFVSVNQSIRPNDFTDRGVPWKSLGFYEVVAGNRFDVFVQSSGGGKVMADAIRLERLTAKMVDDGDAGFEYLTDRGPLTPNTSAGFDGDYHDSSAGREQDGVVYRFGSLPPGSYRVSATWPQIAGAAMNTSFTVNVDGVDHFLSVNQSVPPNDYTDQGAAWEDLGVYEVVAGSRFDVFVQSSGGGTVIADAVRLDPVGAIAAPLVVHVAPSRRDPDSDDDGLTDWEEFTGCHDRDNDLECDDEELRTNPEKRWGPTNPNSADTDGDGLTDREEVDGVDFLGDEKTAFRFTDPLDWDSDDDGRSDGDEVNVSWEVKVIGKPTREVYSDPLKADGDGDGLKDGKEFLLGSDPNNEDTDGDSAGDGVEADRVEACASLGALCLSTTDVLVPDRWISVEFLGLTVGKASINDGDEEDAHEPIDQGAGDFTYALGLTYPVETASGYDSTYVLLTTDQDSSLTAGCVNYYDTKCRNSLQTSTGVHQFIQMREGSTLNVLHNKPGKLLSRRWFAVPDGELFAVSGEVTEWDFEWFNGIHHLKRGSLYQFGGIGSPDGMFTSIEVGTQGLAFESSGDGPPIQVQVIVRAV